MSFKLWTKRSLTVAILDYVTRKIRGKKPLSKNDQFENPVHAMFAFEIAKRGLHQPNRVCAAFYRDFITPKETMALQQNRLKKHPSDKNYPVSERMRSRWRGHNVKDTVRPLDSDIFLDARSLVSRAKSGSDKELRILHDNLHELFDPHFERWKNFKAHCSEGTELFQRLFALHDSLKQNLGNRRTGPGKAVSGGDLKANNAAFESLLKDHGPADDGSAPSTAFWVMADSPSENQSASPPRIGAVSECGLVVFPNGYETVYSQHTLEGIKNICKPSKANKHKNNTNRIRSVKHPELNVKKLLTPKDNNTSIVVRNASNLAFNLLQFEKCQSKPTSPPSSYDPIQSTLLPDHEPADDAQQGIPFWILDKPPKGNQSRASPAENTLSVCGEVTFPAGCPVYPQYTFDAIKGQVRKISELKRPLSIVKGKKAKKVLNEDGLAFVLVRFQVKDPGEDAKPKSAIPKKQAPRKQAPREKAS